MPPPGTGLLAAGLEGLLVPGGGTGVLRELEVRGFTMERSGWRNCWENEEEEGELLEGIELRRTREEELENLEDCAGGLEAEGGKMGDVDVGRR